MSCVPLFLCGEGHSQPRVRRKAVDRVEIRSRHSSRLIRYAPVFCLLFLLNIQIRINYGLNIFCHFTVASYQPPNATTECLSQRPMRMPHRFPPKINLLPSGNVLAPVLVVPLAAQTLESVSLSGSLVRILNQPIWAADQLS